MTANILDLGKAMQVAETDQIWAIRGKAIQAYATLEQSLCSLFAALGDMQSDVAGIIFFKITSTSSRTRILEKLFKLKHGDDFNIFRNSLLAHLSPIDQKRNEIVHWNAVNTVGSDASGNMTCVVSLVPAASWGINNESSLTIPDLIAFHKKCDIFARLINMFVFTVHFGKDAQGFDRTPWLDIFAQPITYPLPEGHPLLPKPATPETPPLTSPA